MKDRMDYYITPKKNSKENFLKLSEDKIIDELDAEMTALRKSGTRNAEKRQLRRWPRYCENITRDSVKFLNKKYGKYFSIKYKCYYKVKKNPPEPELEDYICLTNHLTSLSILSRQETTHGLQKSKKRHEDYEGII